MAWARAALAVAAAVAVGMVVVSGGSGADPRTPAALPGLPAPFLGTAVAGSGGLTAAVDAYGDVVDLRPAGGAALIDNPAARQAAGTVAADTGIVPRVSVDGGPALPLWRADSVSQRYLLGTNVVRTVARFGEARAVVVVAAGSAAGARVPRAGPGRTSDRFALGSTAGGVRCARERHAGQLDLLCTVGRAAPPVSGGAVESRSLGGGVRPRWLARARPLGAGAPAWARRMYERSLLTLRALTSSKTGAVAAGARDGWAYVWPRDAATAALAFEAAGYRAEARRVSRFLSGLDLEPPPASGRRGAGAGTRRAGRRHRLGPAGGGRHGHRRSAVAAPPTGVAQPRRLPGGRRRRVPRQRDRRRRHPAPVRNQPRPGPPRPGRGLGTRLGRGLGGAPVPPPSAFPAARRTLLRLLAAGTPYGITPGEGWQGGTDPWTAPTAWSAWALAALGDRGAALRLLGDLRRAATPAGSLPERVDARTGVPRSTTPLAWSHAFAVLALREALAFELKVLRLLGNSPRNLNSHLGYAERRQRLSEIRSAS